MSPWKIALPFLTVYVTGMPRYKPRRTYCACAAVLANVTKKDETASKAQTWRRDFVGKADLRESDAGEGR
jgi:hypothetical protein